jgi:leucyl/phenylalanyl-tRNA--protein transferase
MTPSVEDTLAAYIHGYFPMAENRDAEEFHWYDPPMRGQLPIAELHIPKRLRKTILRFPFEIGIDTDFIGVIDGCAERPSTWINDGIRDLFIELHKAGHAHSIECRKDGQLVGGIYGLALGGAFCGESMFSRATDASKIALVHLCARLWKGGFTVLDAQFVNDHLRQFGVYEIGRDEYRRRLQEALILPADFSLKSWPDLDEKDLIHEYLEQNLK